jgi:hypothetical protein
MFDEFGRSIDQRIQNLEPRSINESINRSFNEFSRSINRWIHPSIVRWIRPIDQSIQWILNPESIHRLYFDEFGRFNRSMNPKPWMDPSIARWIHTQITLIHWSILMIAGLARMMWQADGGAHGEVEIVGGPFGRSLCVEALQLPSLGLLWLALHPPARLLGSAHQWLGMLLRLLLHPPIPSLCIEVRKGKQVGLMHIIITIHQSYWPDHHRLIFALETGGSIDYMAFDHRRRWLIIIAARNRSSNRICRMIF